MIMADDLKGAVELYLWKADYALSDSAEHNALWSATRVVTLKSNSLLWSKSLLERCLQTSGFPHLAKAHAYMATLLMEEQPRESIEHWQWALYHGHNQQEAPQWRVRLATALENEGDLDGAIDVWEEAIDDQESARVAHLALGRIHLKRNPDVSLYHFQQAKELASSDQLRATEIGADLARYNLMNLE